MIITQTPLRISFLGGNTDFAQYYQKYGGCVLTTAIDKYIYCTIHKRFDDLIYVNWSEKEIVESVSQIKHELVAEAMKKVGVTKGVEISFYSDIPSGGSGLGSSSSVTVGVLNALHQFVGETVSAQQLASEAVDIEINILKKPIGIQDQYIAAFGGLRFFEFKTNGQVNSQKIKISPGAREDFDNSLMLFYTGKTHNSQTILTDVRKNITLKKASLNKVKILAYKGKDALESGHPEKIGELLNEHWSLKKEMGSGVSNSNIDKMYKIAIDAGAMGGKIAGSGGGGFLLLMVPSSSRENVRRALKNYRELPFRLGVEGSRIIFNIHQP